MNFSAWSRLTWFAALLFTVACGGGSGGGLAADAGAGAGGDSGEPATFSIEDAEVKEGDASTRDLQFTVTLSHALNEVAKVAYQTHDETAQSSGVTSAGGGDYEDISATLRFEAGETEKAITVRINGDRREEKDETFRITLSKPLGASLGQVNATGTILNDDFVLPALSIDGANITEGNAGSSDGILHVTLSEPSDEPVTVEFSTGGGTATEDDDYDAAQGTLTFAPGETEQEIIVAVTGDTTVEPNEFVDVTLSNPQGATLGVADATLIIENDDSAGPTLSVSDATTSEGSFGSKNITFTITLSQALATSVSVDYATVDGTATSSGQSSAGGLDYAATSDSVTFVPGETQKLVSVIVYGDQLNEPDETFSLELYDVAGATVVDPRGVGTIQNDDTQPKLVIGDAMLTEGAAGTRTASFAVSLSPASGQTVTVNYATSDNTATSGADYVAASGKLTFVPGQTSAYVSVSIDGDLLDENDETFWVSLSNAANATINDVQAVGTVLDDDDEPQLAINDVAIVEGSSGSKNAVFDVSLSAASGRDVSVSWTTNDLLATAGLDYGAGSGLLSFPVGTISRSITVPILGDVLDEGNETFTVDLSSPLHATLADGQGLGTIVTDDTTLPGLTISDASIAEGAAGTAILSLTVTLSASSAQQVKVNYQTIDDMAVAGSDYQALSGTLIFSAGQTSKSIDVIVNGDALDELDETLYVALDTAVNAYISDGVGVGTISNDDVQPSLSIDDVTTTEGNAGKKNATFTISLSTASGIAVGVSYATKDGTAVEAGLASSGQDDYDAASDIVFIPAGQTSAKISVPINGDTLTEANETFQVLLSAPQNASILDGTGQGVINNDDAPPNITISDVSLAEGDAGSKTFTFTLTLSVASGDAVSVDYATADGTALSGLDYTAASGTAVFPSGKTTTTIDVQVLGETAVEGHKNETFVVDLSNAQGAAIGDAQATGTILDDD